MTLEEKLKKEMEENTAIQEYLKQFEEKDVESFVKTYLRNKLHWLNNGSYYREKKDDGTIEWINKAFQHLGNIQQKKLFDAQCLWRAEQLHIPEVEIAFDFEVWGNDILNCKFIEPISEEDIELYGQFLLTHEVVVQRRMRNFNDWQNYFELKDAYEKDNVGKFPEWYLFYDNRRGTNGYMILPNTRGNKENFYRILAYEYQQAQKGISNEEPYAYKEDLFYYDKKQRDYFVHTFESKQVQQLYHAVEWFDHIYSLENEAKYFIEIMASTDEIVPMEADENWLEAIKKSTRKFVTRKIIEALPLAWEQYMINIQMNIDFQVDTSEKNHSLEIRKMIYDNIMLGRKLNGEPEDVDF